MAKEYIDKELAISMYQRKLEKCNEVLDNFPVGNPLRTPYETDAVECRNVIRAVKAFHAADVRENVRGRWIEDSDGDGRHCSVCGKDYCYLISDCETYIFCPNCGAQMGGAEDG